MLDKMKSAFGKSGKKTIKDRLSSGFGEKAASTDAPKDKSPLVPASTLFQAGAFIVDSQGIIRDANMVGEILLHTSARNLKGRHLQEVFPDVFQNKFLHEIISSAMGNCAPQTHHGIQIKTSGDDVFLADLSVLPFDAGSGSPVFFIIVKLTSDAEQETQDVESIIRQKNLGARMNSMIKEIDVQISATRQLVSDLKNCVDTESFQTYTNIFGAHLDSARQILRKYRGILEKNDRIRSTQINNIARKLLVEIDLLKKFDDHYIKLDKKLEDSSKLPEIELDAEAVFPIMKDFFFNLYNSLEAGSTLEIQTQFQENKRDPELDAGSFPEVCVLFKWYQLSEHNEDDTFAMLGGDKASKGMMAIPDIDNVDRHLAEFGGQVKTFAMDNACVIGFHFPVPLPLD